MKRTFRGFLRSYCSELAGRETASLRKLCAAADGGSARVAEPLFLFALEEGKLDYLLGLATGTWMEPEWRALALDARRFDSAECYLGSGLDVPERYRRVLDAWRAPESMRVADKRVVALMRPKILEALAVAGCTRYRMVADLGLNKGNVYAYLAGNDAKVSRATARRILDYALALPVK